MGAVERVREIISEVVDVEEIAEIEEVVGEARRELSQDFWSGKMPCWETCHCPEMIKNECPAAKYAFLPCWEIEGTYCKLDDYGATGKDTSICQLCRVYKRYGQNKPIELKLLGRGMDTSLRAVEKEAAAAK